MIQRYEVVLDGVDLSDDEHDRLERAIQDVARDFLAERAGGAAEKRHTLVSDRDELRDRLARLPKPKIGRGPITAGLWIGDRGA